MKSALCYVEETLICAEIVKLLPPSLAQYVTHRSRISFITMISGSKIIKLSALRLMGGIMGRRLKSQKVIFDALLPIAEDRCRERDLKAGGQAVPHHVRSL
jgi:hypothetical protein